MNRVTIPAVILFAVFMLPVIGRVSAQTPSRTNEAKSEFRAGMRYYNADKPDFVKAFPLILKAAKEGDAGAQAQVAYMYQEGLGVSKDRAAAIRWAKKSADQNNSIGENTLGYLYRTSANIPNRYQKAFQLYQSSAKQGNPTGEASLGWMYVHGYGVALDYSKAIYWFRKSIEQHGSDGANDLSVSYYFGQGVEKSKLKSLKWLYIAEAFPKTTLIRKIKSNIVNLEAQMSRREIAEAHKLAAKWLSETNNARSTRGQEEP
ncbi:MULTISPECIES: tetratricopeptide repeat protein [Acidiphilium]|uniref:Sel1 repeat family protein n=1 Tax=Acidiphilium rubrum TaxID=526 RepID=A0A8G2FF58_ACIRU|nr:MULTISPECIES: tetratricopeptide repeat protein [Acidiphilium]SIR29256.1 hypothetical protein SAMN05421828_12320 [Acidiphilium rubrum]